MNKLPGVGVVRGKDEQHWGEDEGNEGDGAGPHQVQDGPELGNGLGNEEKQQHGARPGSNVIELFMATLIEFF